MTTATFNQDQAEKAYQAKRDQIESEIARLGNMVGKHNRSSEGHRNWAHVGDLNAIAEALREITEGK